MPNGAVDGDLLICTKPLGTQVSVNLHQWADLNESDRLKKVTLNNQEILKELIYNAHEFGFISVSRTLK